MTPQELEQVRRMIRDAIDKAVADLVQPLRTEFDAMRFSAERERPKRYSAKIEEAVVEAKRGDVRVATEAEDKIIAAVAHATHVVDTLRADVNARLEKLEAPTKRAEQAANLAEGRTAAMQVGVDRIDTKTDRLASTWRNPALNQVVSTAVLTVLGYLATHGHC